MFEDYFILNAYQYGRTAEAAGNFTYTHKFTYTHLT